MRITKSIAGAAIAASMIAATSAGAVDLAKAPTSGVRTTATAKHKSNQAEGGTPVLGYALAAVFAGGLVAATIAGTDNSSNARPASNG